MSLDIIPRRSPPPRNPGEPITPFRRFWYQTFGVDEAQVATVFVIPGTLAEHMGMIRIGPNSGHDAVWLVPTSGQMANIPILLTREQPLYTTWEKTDINVYPARGSALSEAGDYFTLIEPPPGSRTDGNFYWSPVEILCYQKDSIPPFCPTRRGPYYDSGTADQALLGAPNARTVFIAPAFGRSIVRVIFAGGLAGDTWQLLASVPFSVDPLTGPPPIGKLAVGGFPNPIVLANGIIATPTTVNTVYVDNFGAGLILLHVGQAAGAARVWNYSVEVLDEA